MTSYGRNFEFRIAPTPEQRKGRYVTGGAVIPIGAPVAVSGAPNADGRLPVALATGATAPVQGQHGVAVFEWAYNAYAGLDPVLRNPSDFGDIPAASPIQLVSGPTVKVVLRNTTTASLAYLGANRGTPRVMVAPANLGTLAVGDLLRPGTGNDTAGYWVEATAGDDAWLIVTGVDTARGEVEAQMAF